ncbi:unnamed protein product [Musa textilis]
MDDELIFGTLRPLPLLTVISRWCSLPSLITIIELVFLMEVG